LVRPRISAYIATREELNATAAAVFKFLERDGVKIDIFKVYPLRDAAQAQDDLESGKTTGKLLLKA
jgi:NADPH2:quinone reductase